MMARIITAHPFLLLVWLGLSGVAYVPAGMAYGVDKTLDLGVLSGVPDAKLHNMVSVTRVLPDELVFTLSRDSVETMPAYIEVRNADSVVTSSNSFTFTTRVGLGLTSESATGLEARMTWELALFVDGKRVSPQVTRTQSGGGVALVIPPDAFKVDLVSVAPVTMTVPAGYSGAALTSLDISGIAHGAMPPE